MPIIRWVTIKGDQQYSWHGRPTRPWPQ